LNLGADRIDVIGHVRGLHGRVDRGVKAFRDGASTCLAGSSCLGGSVVGVGAPEQLEASRANAAADTAVRQRIVAVIGTDYS
jgi:hypothetical protein